MYIRVKIVGASELQSGVDALNKALELLKSSDYAFELPSLFPLKTLVTIEGNDEVRAPLKAAVKVVGLEALEQIVEEANAKAKELNDLLQKAYLGFPKLGVVFESETPADSGN